jgi:predicted  nucleic acid-binding Zn-ribbon protein
VKENFEEYFSEVDFEKFPIRKSGGKIGPTLKQAKKIVKDSKEHLKNVRMEPSIGGLDNDIALLKKTIEKLEKRIAKLEGK